MLPRGSSALVLLGGAENLGKMVGLFKSSNAEVIRRSVGDELLQALEELDRETEAAALS
jgi:hypothetical protein